VKARAIITTLFFSVVAGVLAIVFPEQRHTILVVWVLTILGYSLMELNAHSRALVGERSRFDRLLEDLEREPDLPEDLRRLERGLGWITYEPSYFDFRVRPILRELIHHRVRERLDIDLTKDPAKAAGHVDAELLNLASERKAEELYGTRNLETPDIFRMITRIEEI
jgi:hypothetical protein